MIHFEINLTEFDSFSRPPFLFFCCDFIFPPYFFEPAEPLRTYCRRIYPPFLLTTSPVESREPPFASRLRARYGPRPILSSLPTPNQ